MIDAFTLADLEARVKAADARYGTFASTHEALGVAAVCIRLAMQIEDPRLAMRSVK
jgi:hypothetical protein